MGFFHHFVRLTGPSPAGGAVVPEIGAPHFTFGPTVAIYMQYCIFKLWPPLLVFGPSFWFLPPPLLLNPGDGPGGLHFFLQVIERSRIDHPQSFLGYFL